MDNSETTQLRLTISTDDSEKLAHLGKRLYRDVTELAGGGVSWAEVVQNGTEVTKSGTVIDWTTILVALSSSSVLTAIIALVQGYLTRERTITMEIDGDKLELTGGTAEQHSLLIDAWIRRHSRSKKGKPK
jgi:hypothetical protein